MVEFYKYDKRIELKRKGCNWTFAGILDQHFSLASINLSKYCFKVSSVYCFNFIKFANINSGFILEKCAWNIVCMLFQFWTKFSGKFIYQMHVFSINEFGNNLNFRNSESITSVHWQMNLAICSRADIDS